MIFEKQAWYANTNRTFYKAHEHPAYPGINKYVVCNGVVNVSFPNKTKAKTPFAEYLGEEFEECSLTPFAALQKLLISSYGAKLSNFYSHYGCGEKISTLDDIRKYKYIIRYRYIDYDAKIVIYDGQTDFDRLYNTPKSAAYHAVYVHLRNKILKSWNEQNPEEAITI